MTKISVNEADLRAAVKDAMAFGFQQAVQSLEEAKEAGINPRISDACGIAIAILKAVRP